MLGGPNTVDDRGHRGFVRHSSNGDTPGLVTGGIHRSVKGALGLVAARHCVAVKGANRRTRGRWA